jgi:hypothetical protein
MVTLPDGNAVYVIGLNKAGVIPVKGKLLQGDKKDKEGGEE